MRYLILTALFLQPAFAQDAQREAFFKALNSLNNTVNSVNRQEPRHVPDNIYAQNQGNDIMLRLEDESWFGSSLNRRTAQSNQDGPVLIYDGPYKDILSQPRPQVAQEPEEEEDPVEIDPNGDPLVEMTKVLLGLNKKLTRIVATIKKNRTDLIRMINGVSSSSSGGGTVHHYYTPAPSTPRSTPIDDGRSYPRGGSRN